MIVPHLTAEVPAVPLIPAAALYLLGMLAFCGFLIASGMLKVYAETLGTFIRWLAREIDVGIPTGVFGRVHPLRGVSRGLYGMDGAIRKAFAAVILRSESAAAWSFTTAGNIVHWTARELADLSRDVTAWAQRTRVATIPAVVRRAEAATLNRLRGIDHSIGRIEAQAHALERRLLAGIDRINARVTHVIPQAIASVRERVGTLERGFPRLGKRVTALERKWALPAVTAVVATALSRLGLRWLRCSNVKKAGESVCKMDSNLLESLLLDAAALAVAFDLVTFAKEVQAITETVAGEIHKFAHAD